MYCALTQVLTVSLLAAAIAADDVSLPPAAKPTLSDLAWFSGSWYGQGLGGDIEEHWTSARGGTMVGSFRLIAGGATKVVEYLMITEDSGRVVYRFKHFRKDFSTLEKDRPLEFTLMSVSEDACVFHSEVPDQHSPRRLTYRRIGSDTLAVLVEGSDQDGILNEGFEVRYGRC
jgi:hypothetical protein